MGVPQRAGFERFQILSRLEHKFKLVDVDRSHAVDFFEFLYLGFLMTQEGCYSDLVEESEVCSHSCLPASVHVCMQTQTILLSF